MNITSVSRRIATMSGKGFVSAKGGKGAKGGKAWKGKGFADREERIIEPPRVIREEELPGGGVLREIVYDLFTANTCLCHCVSRCLNMGKGIAVKFKHEFRGIPELKAQNPTVGKMCVLHRNGRFIYYLITKEHYSHKPTYEDLTSSLEDMARHMAANGIKEVAMPRIGCGLDRLEWDKVRVIIKTVFADCPGTISVYSLTD